MRVLAMTSRTRRLRSLLSFLSAVTVVTLGLGGAGPAFASADPGGNAADPQLGAVLQTRWQPVSGGNLKVTEFENGTTFAGTMAGCNVAGTALKPTKSSTRIRGKSRISISGCGSSPWIVDTSIAQPSTGEPDILNTFTVTVYPPYSAEFSTPTACKRGKFLSVLSINKGTNYHYDESPTLSVSSC